MVNVGRAFDARNGIAFQEQPKDGPSPFDGEIHPLQRLIAGINKQSSALPTLIPLPPPALPKFPTLGPATVTRHAISS